MNKDKKFGCIRQYMLGKEFIDWVKVEDLTSEDKETQDLVQGWLNGLDEPWSDFSVDYQVSIPYQPPAEMNLDILWCAEYTSIFYDGMESVAFGYGPTPEDAIANVNKMVAEVIEKYYKGKDEDDE